MEICKENPHNGSLSIEQVLVMSVYCSKEKRASITVSATFGHQKTRSESSNAIYLWDLRALSSKSIAWGGRRYDQGRFERLQNMLLPSGKVNFAGHYSGREKLHVLRRYPP